MYEHYKLLLHIANKKGLYRELKTSTSRMSQELDISQQSISRKLRKMESLGLIRREVKPKGISVFISEKGAGFLKSRLAELEKIFAGKEKISGTAKSGIGEGSYYVSLSGYQKHFKKKLGFEAFPGTLNLKINRGEVNDFIKSIEKVQIPGFKTKARTFGALDCYRLKVKSINAAIVMPERARHKEDIIEVIAPVDLRKRLKLKDGDKIALSR